MLVLVLVPNFFVETVSVVSLKLHISILYFMTLHLVHFHPTNVLCTSFDFMTSVSFRIDLKVMALLSIGIGPFILQPLF